VNSEVHKAVCETPLWDHGLGPLGSRGRSGSGSF
jgi:hypothetical protein